VRHAGGVVPPGYVATPATVPPPPAAAPPARIRGRVGR
jgi:hypothetical protein